MITNEMMDMALTKMRDEINSSLIPRARELNAAFEKIASRERLEFMKYCIIDTDRFNIIKSFKTKKECRAWLMEGMFSCEGAERDHYVNMLSELECGKKSLKY